MSKSKKADRSAVRVVTAAIVTPYGAMRQRPGSFRRRERKRRSGAAEALHDRRERPVVVADEDMADPQLLAEHFKLFDQAVHTPDEDVRGLENVPLRQVDAVAPANLAGDLTRHRAGLIGHGR